MESPKFFSQLSPEVRQHLEKKLEPIHLRELLSLSRETDPELFFEALLHFGCRMKRAHEDDLAGLIFQLIQQAPAPADIRQRAQEELDAMRGVGNIGLRLEYLGSRFTENALSYQMILPMTFGTGVYQLAKTSAEMKLATLAGRTWLSRGLSRKFAASFLGTLPEIPAFALSSQGLHLLAGDPIAPTSDVVKSTAVTLGFMKPFMFAGNRAFAGLHRVDPAGMPTRWISSVRVTRPLLSQTAMFGSLVAAHKLERYWDLRPKVDGATFYTDIFESMVSLGIGSQVGHRALGRGYEGFQQDLRFRLRILDHQEAVGKTLGKPRYLSPAVAGMAAAAYVLSPELAHAALEGGKVISGESGMGFPEFLTMLGLGTGALGMVKERGRKRRRGPPKPPSPPDMTQKGVVRVPVDDVTTRREQAAPVRESSPDEEAVPVEFPPQPDFAQKVDLNPFSVPEPVSEDRFALSPPVPIAREASDSVPDTKPQFVSVAEFSVAMNKFQISSREERAARTAKFVACKVVEMEQSSEGIFLHFHYAGTIFRMLLSEEPSLDVSEIYLDPTLLPLKI